MSAPRAILDKPLDMGLRLAHADAIEGTDPDRARFIRLQVQIRAALARGEDRPPGLKSQAGRLHREHHAAWKAELAPLALDCFFAGGFVEHVVMDPEQWLSNADRLVSQTPLLWLTLTRLGSLRDPILASSQLARLKGLSLVGAGITDDDVEHLVQSPHLKGLWALELRANGLGRTALDAVARHLPQLRCLEFSANAVDPRASVGVDRGQVVHVGPSGVLAELKATHGDRAWFSALDWPRDLFQAAPDAVREAAASAAF